MEKTNPNKKDDTPEKLSNGRPSGITPEFLAMANAYLEKYKELNEVIPTIEGLALFTATQRTMLQRWAKEDKSEDFRYIYSRLMAMQGKDLINCGLEGRYNSTITKLILTKHDYRDAKDERISDSNGKPFKVNVINYGDTDTVQVQAKETPAGVSTEQS